MYKIIRPLLFLPDPEFVHNAAIKLGSFLSERKYAVKLIEKIYNYEAPELKNEVLNLYFKNPVGLASGFDKNAELADLAPALGFGYTTVGSVTSYKFNGRRKPRLFRLAKDKAIINRIGLKNAGADDIYKKLSCKRPSIPVGVSISKSNRNTIQGHKEIQDYMYTYEGLYETADYFEINPWCPSLKNEQMENETLEKILRMMNYYKEEQKKQKPTLIKLPADLTVEELDKVLEICENNFMDGYVVCNTTNNRTGLRTSARKLNKIGNGGLSGMPLAGRAEELTKEVYKRTGGKKVIIGVGGVNAENAYARILAGATLLQVYTGLVYEGPSLVKKINKELARRMRADGVKNIKDIVGKAVE